MKAILLFILTIFLLFSCDTEEKISENLCTPNPCKNSGECTVTENSYSCICKENYTGVNCENETINNCKENSCSENSICVSKVDGYDCNCKEGYSGENCNECSDGYELEGILCLLAPKYYQWGTESSDNARSVILDNDNNLYFTGYTWGGAFEEISYGEKDLFITKMNSSNEIEWTKQWGSSLTEEGYSMVVDKDNNIYVTGYTEGELNGNSNLGESDIFLMKINSLGEEQWTKQWGTPKSDFGFSLTIDNDNNIYVAGNTEGDLGGVKGNKDLFITKLNSSGDIEWTKQWGTPEDDSTASIKLDNDNNIYLLSSSWNNEQTVYETVLIKFNNSGDEQWVKKWTTTDWSFGRSLEIYKDNIYFTGVTRGSLDGISVTDGYQQSFLIKLNLDGENIFIKQWGSGDNDDAYSLSIMEDFVYITGWTVGSFNGYTNNGSFDIFLTKINTNGDIQYTKQWGTPEREQGYSIVTNNKNIFITGYTEGNLVENIGEMDIFLMKIER